ncbi:MAG: hypothetical protein ACYDD1_19630 [Caulobacteraceae bacterium]
MNQPVQRRSLLAGLDERTKDLPSDAVAQTAAKNGFEIRADAPAPARQVGASEPVFARKRPKTGRDHQFNVRLRADTMEQIYDRANSRNIPVAQVIEEAMEALLAPSRRG